MTEDDARKHAQRMIDTFPNGPKAYVWRELFNDLDGAIAHGAYHALIKTAPKAPTPGQFMEHYRAQMPRAEARITRSDPDGISLAEYLERVTTRAVNGNHDAVAELERWGRHLNAGAPRRLIEHPNKETAL